MNQIFLDAVINGIENIEPSCKCWASYRCNGIAFNNQGINLIRIDTIIIVTFDSVIYDADIVNWVICFSFDVNTHFTTIDGIAFY